MGGVDRDGFTVPAPAGMQVTAGFADGGRFVVECAQQFPIAGGGIDQDQFLIGILIRPNFPQQQTIAQLFAKVYEDIKLRHSQSSALVYDYIHLQYG